MKTLKSLALTITLVVSTQAMAVDFGAIIKENSQAQNELHKQIKETVDSSRIAAQNSDTGSQVIADNAQTIHVKTNKSMLTFAKEKRHKTVTPSQSDKRLAQELKDLE